MQIKNDIGFFQQPKPFLHLFGTHSTHVVANVSIVDHLTGTAGNRNEAQKFDRFNIAVQLADIAFNICLQIAGIEQIAV